jgi:hypothetical protein
MITPLLVSLLPMVLCVVARAGGTLGACRRVGPASAADDPCVGQAMADVQAASCFGAVNAATRGDGERVLPHAWRLAAGHRA